MKFRDVKTISHILKEYGMQPGASTPVAQQKSAQSAKANKSVTSQGAKPSLAKSPSPTTSPVKQPNDTEQPAQIMRKASELEVGTEFKDEKGKVKGVVTSPIGDGPKPDAVVVQDPRTKKYTVMQPDEVVNIDNPELQEESAPDPFERLAKRKHKIGRKIKKLLRAQKHAQQGNPIFEINFNNRGVAQSALNAPIKCGFEAETTWPNVQGGMEDDDGDWMEGMTWSDVSDLIYDQEGSRSVDRIEERYREWLQESDYFYNAESDVISELVDERKEDEYYLNDYVSSKISETDIEDYRDDMLADLESAKDEGSEDAAAELEERESWDMDAWGREYVEVNDEGGFEEWLADEIRDNGEQWDDAWERAMEAADIDRYMEDEHGSWYDLLRSEDIYLYNQDAGGGRDEVASRLEDWASNNSRSNDVRAGDYHSGSGVDNTYWRVEDDSSIEGEGTGAEIISPVYDSPAEMLKEMKSLFEFLESEGVETNSSTGLHITMSWTESDNVDAGKLKMALLLGDKYVAKQYGRESNGYSKSQMQNIQRYMDDVKQDINNEKSLGALEQIISKGISPGKFSSINFKDAENEHGNNLIEFRVAGGNDYHTMMDTIVKTVIRYGAVMQAGHDREAFRKDYVKALFRLISGQDDITTDVQRKAQQVVDPETIDDKVLSAFQTIASKKHYTDSIEALSNAYMQLADVKKMRAEDPQGELDLGEDEEAESQDWRRAMIKAQKYFVRAFAMLASDVASGANRAPAKAAQVAALRGAMKDFGLTADILWSELQQSEFVKRFPGDHHNKLEKMAKAVNSLLKKQDAKAPEAAYTISVPRGHVVAIPTEKHRALFGDLFGNNKPDGDAAISQQDFKVIDDDEIDKVKRARYEIEYNERFIRDEQEIVDSFADKIKTEQDPDKKADLAHAVKTRQAKIDQWNAENAQHKQTVDAFVKKHGFAPASIRSSSEPIGTPYSFIHDDQRKDLSQRFNIKFDVQESVFTKFDKLPLEEKLALLNKIDTVKLNEAWSKKYKDSINCSNPKGFSQKAHCAGKKKKNETIEAEQDMAALLTAYGTPKKKKKSAKVKEGDVVAFPGTHVKKEYVKINNVTMLKDVWEYMSQEREMETGKRNFTGKEDPKLLKKAYRAELENFIDEFEMNDQDPQAFVDELNRISESYGRYYCSTDKKWKERKGPKQKRKVKETAVMEKALGRADLKTPDRRQAFAQQLRSNADFDLAGYKGKIKLDPSMTDSFMTAQTPADLPPKLQTADGQVVPYSVLEKTPAFGARGGDSAETTGTVGKVANKGEVAEGILGCGTFARLLVRPSKDVTQKDIESIIRKLPKDAPEKDGFHQLTLTAKEINRPIADQFTLTLNLKPDTYADFLDESKWPQMQSISAGIADYVNDNLKRYTDYFQANGKVDEVRVIADGVSGETDTKVDVFLVHKEEGGAERTLQHFDMSVKVGSTKQIGQVGGGRGTSSLEDRFGILADMWDKFGVDLGKVKSKFVKSKTPEDAYVVAYTEAAKQMKQRLAGVKKSGETEYLMRLIETIKFFATLNDDRVKLVQFTDLKKGGFYVLDFKKLDRMLDADRVDLDVKLVEDSKWPKITLYNKVTGKEFLSIRMYRTAGGYIRNYIEKEKGLVDLTKVRGTGMRKKVESIREGAVPNNDRVNKLREIMSKPLLTGDLKGQMEAYTVVPVPSMIKDFRAARASSGDEFDLRNILRSYAKSRLHPDVLGKV